MSLLFVGDAMFFWLVDEANSFISTELLLSFSVNMSSFEFFLLLDFFCFLNLKVGLLGSNWPLNHVFILNYATVDSNTTQLELSSNLSVSDFNIDSSHYKDPNRYLTFIHLLRV